MAEVNADHRNAARLALYGDRPSKFLQILRWIETGEANAGISEMLPRIAQAIADAEARGRGEK